MFTARRGRRAIGVAGLPPAAAEAVTVTLVMAPAAAAQAATDGQRVFSLPSTTNRGLVLPPINLLPMIRETSNLARVPWAISLHKRASNIDTDTDTCLPRMAPHTRETVGAGNLSSLHHQRFAGCSINEIPPSQLRHFFLERWVTQHIQCTGTFARIFIQQTGDKIFHLPFKGRQPQVPNHADTKQTSK